MKKPGRLLMLFLVALMALVPMAASGCRSQAPAPAAVGLDLARTQVPKLDLDAYVYVKQEQPTRVPGSLVGQDDLAVESLAVWGVVDGSQLAIGGALTFTNAADAARVPGQVPAQSGIWTSLSDRTVYFVQGAAGAAQKLKDAISRKDFKTYNDADSLAAAARLPNGGDTKLAAIAVVKPSPPVVKLAAGYTSNKMGDMAGGLVAVAQLQPVVAGLYAPGQIDVADIAKRARAGTVWEVNLGVLALVKSGLPGAVVSPLAGKVLENAGFTVTSIGGMSVYKGTLEVGSGGKTIPVLVNLDGNSLTVAGSGKEAYAQALITGLKK